MVVRNTWPYRVDGELGRVEFPTYQVCQDDTILYDTPRELFPPLGCWERYETIGFKELAFMYGVTERSCRKTETLLNRIRHQEGATGATTLRTSAEREGKQVMACLERTATTILLREGFDETGQPLRATPFGRTDAVVLSAEQINAALAVCTFNVDERTEMAQNPVPYEQPQETVNISIDDVIVKKQKRHRTRPGEQNNLDEEDESGRKYVHNTVVHVQHQEFSYCLTGQGVPAVLRLVLSYLLVNALLGFRLQFFVDGQKTLQAAILRAFSWFRNVGVILDWYHLEDKCKRQLSLAMKGRAQRNDMLERLTPLLWHGRVTSAIAYLQSVSEETMKNPDAIRGLIGYLERNRPYIPCYEIRKQLGLRNSSNVGEKMNDLLVSDRQKHKGMSWSVSGSSALAALEALKRNNTSQHWFEYHEIPFKQAA
jgi:hypothetical protein